GPRRRLLRPHAGGPARRRPRLRARPRLRRPGGRRRAHVRPRSEAGRHPHRKALYRRPKGHLRMRIAFFGDVVGRAGRDGLAEHLPALRRRRDLEFVTVTAENAAAGLGITENTARELYHAGADCLTLGTPSWDQKEALTYIVREPRLIRPLNYPV